MDTRKKILESGLRVFSQKGYLGATIKEIVKEAGVAEITFFRYFPSKEQFFEEVIKTYSFAPALQEIIFQAQILPYEEGLKVIAKGYLESLALQKDLITIMHLEVQRYPDKIKEIYHAFVDRLYRELTSYFSDMQKKGILRSFTPEIGSRAFLGLLFSHFNAQEFLLSKEYRRWESDQVIDEFVTIFVQGTLKDNQKSS